jgi:hypothetical protein
MNEIVTDIFAWTWFSEPHGYHFNGYLVRHAEGNLCIDPVPRATSPSLISSAWESREFCSPIATIHERPT